MINSRGGIYNQWTGYCALQSCEGTWILVRETLSVHLSRRQESAQAQAADPSTMLAAAPTESEPSLASPWQSIGMFADVELDSLWIDVKAQLDMYLGKYDGQMAAHLLRSSVQEGAGPHAGLRQGPLHALASGCGS